MISRKFSFIWVIACIITILSACKSNSDPDPVDPIDPVDPDEPAMQRNFVFVSQGAAMTAGINSVDNDLAFEVNTSLDKELDAPVEIDPIKKDKLKRIITIDALADGQKVTDICFWEQYVFVSHMDPGQKYRGTVDVYSLKNVPNLKRVTRFQFADTETLKGIDIHAVSYTLGRLLLACSSAEKPAFIEQIIYNPNESMEPVLKKYVDIPASSLSGITIIGNKIYTLADKENAGVYIHNLETMVQEHYVPIQDPLSMTPVSGNNEVVVLQNGTPMSLVKVTSTGQSSTVTASTEASQNMGIVAKDRVYARSGNQVQVFNSNYSVKQQPFSWTGENTQVNASYKNVAVMKDWLLILGNGGNGVRVCGLRNRSEADVTEISDLSDVGQSLSLLSANDNIALIANQDGTLQMLWRVSFGMPEVPIYLLELEKVMETVANTIASNVDKQTKYPELFVKDIPLTIKTTSKTKIYISIVKQNATFSSSIGYYLFNSNALPAEASGLSKVALFPSTLLQGTTGNTIPMCDAEGKAIEFEAGQEIGFYFIPNGWSSSLNDGYGGVDYAKPTMYTHLQYNQQQSQQHILFRINGQNPLFMGFEDTWIIGGTSDKDMDDFIISISDNLNNAPVTKLSVEGIKALD